MDNKDNTQIFSLEEIMREFSAGTDPEDTARSAADEAPEAADEVTAPEPVTEEAPEQPEEAGEPEQEPVSEEPLPEEMPPQEAPEIQEPEAPAEKAAPFQLAAEEIPAPQPILFRSRLSELKRKLVAGPEKRYYDLTEIGLGRVQAAIFVSFLVVLLCGGGTVLYGMGLVLENRLRLMVFSQVLAMMVCATLGCYVLLEGITDLFTGKFSLNSMLFLTLAACSADAFLCLQEQRVPCCAAFCLEMTLALWNRSLRRQTEMGQMDTLRKATRLDGLVKADNYFGSLPGIVRTEGRPEDFMEHYDKRTGPERTLNIFGAIAVPLCIAIAVLAGLRHGMSMAFQVLSTSMLVAVPAGAFVAHSRPAAILERRLHMVGTVLCGWQGVKKLCGKASFPLRDREIFPLGAAKLNGVKFLEDWEPEQVIAWAASLMNVNGGGLESVFTQLLKSRSGHLLPVEEAELLESGIRGQIQGRDVMLGTQELMQQQGIAIPEGTQVAQAVYCAVDSQLAAVFAISYSRTKAAAGGLVTLGSYRKLRPLVLCRDFLIDESLLRGKFGIRTKRYDFPARADREALDGFTPDPELVAGALTTQVNLSAAAYAVTGAKALRTASRVGTGLHIFAGLVGMLVMAALAYLGDLQLLSPFNILLYQLVWLVPGILVTEWTRTV